MKVILERIINNFNWGDWIDIDTVHYVGVTYLVQMKVNANNKKTFRRTRVCGHPMGATFKNIPYSDIPDMNK